eukprot:13052976-Alexandrium_andersonii.AAC.1
MHKNILQAQGMELRDLKPGADMATNPWFAGLADREKQGLVYAIKTAGTSRKASAKKKKVGNKKDAKDLGPRMPRMPQP